MDSRLGLQVFGPQRFVEDETQVGVAAVAPFQAASRDIESDQGRAGLTVIETARSCDAVVVANWSPGRLDLLEIGLEGAG